MPCGTILLHMGLVLRQKYAVEPPLFEDARAEAHICKKRDAIFQIGSPSLRAGLHWKVRVALFCNFTEYLRTHQVVWLFCSLRRCKLSFRITL